METLLRLACCRFSTLSDTKYRDIADGNFQEDVIDTFLKRESDTKYRDIADGNNGNVAHEHLFVRWSDTKYRDIADGNFASSLLASSSAMSDTKYRDIADGNSPGKTI